MNAPKTNILANIEQYPEVESDDTPPTGGAGSDESHLADIALQKAAILHELEARAFIDGSPIPQPVPRFYVAGKAVSTPGNLTSVIAQAKSGKSALVGAFVAALFVADRKAMNIDFYGEDEPDTLGISASAPGEGKAVIHIDTEQSDYDHDRLIRTAMRRARIDKKPEWFHSYRLAGYDATKLQLALDALIDKHGPGNIHAIILDGSADFIADVNDAKECNPFIASLHAVAIECHCPVVGVVHENPGAANTGSGKGRGHFGSQLERKAESNICLKKDADGITTVYATKMRGAPIPENTGPRFQWSDEHGMHMSTASKAATKEDAKREKLRELALAVFEKLDRSAASWADILKAIEAIRGIKSSAAEDRFNELKGAGLIEKCPIIKQWKLINPATP